MSYGVGHRCCLDLVLLWWWHRPAAVVLIQPLAWELPYAKGEAPKNEKKKKKKRKKERTQVSKIKNGKKSYNRHHKKQRLIRVYYKQLCDNTRDNIE